MTSIRTCVMLFVLTLTLSLAATAAAQPQSGPEFISLATPCRALDTRVTGTPLQANVPRTIQIGGACGVPTTAAGAELNFTITQAQGAGHMAAWSTGALPQTSAVNFGAGEDVGNAIDIGLGAGGTVIVQSIVNTHLVVDVYGYFTDVEELAGGNTALGLNALASITTGVSNTALGVNALFRNTTGNANTATGASALASNTTGFQNVATGLNALASNTTGAGNTASGVNALFRNTTGDNNTASGGFALTANTTGSDNTASGVSALANNTTGARNTAVGFNALVSNTEGGNNVAIGGNALLFNTTGNANTATGASALASNTTGFQNVATGVNALFGNTTGSDNTASGINALVRNTTGARNTAVGLTALRFNTTGNENIAVGAGAGADVTTGSNNIHIGNQGANESTTIRIGSGHTRSFIAGIRGVTTGVNDAVLVLIDGEGQLGTATSSRRVKTDIRDLADDSRALHQLRPVSFRYRSHPPDGPLEYGLIAEEVAEIYPELVVRDTEGQPSGVRYHVLPAMLLNELQRQRQLEAQQRELDELRTQVRALIGAKAAAQQ